MNPMPVDHFDKYFVDNTNSENDEIHCASNVAYL